MKRFVLCLLLEVQMVIFRISRWAGAVWPIMYSAMGVKLEVLHTGRFPKNELICSRNRNAVWATCMVTGLSWRVEFPQEMHPLSTLGPVLANSSHPCRYIPHFSKKGRFHFRVRPNPITTSLSSKSERILGEGSGIMWIKKTTSGEVGRGA